MDNDKIRLRALIKDDAKISWDWRNKENLRYYYSGHPFFVTLEKQEAWLDSLLGSDIPRTSFGIEEIETGSLIGMSFLMNIDLIHRTAEFSIFIGEENAKGKGYGKEATLKTVEFAFMHLNLNRVSLKVQEDNYNAIKLYEKCKFRKEGILRECLYKNGHYLNEIIMSLLRSEYFEIQ